MRFLQIQIKNWRNFTNADVQLAQRVFVVGPNAAGKSNFLDVFRFLHDVAAEGGGLRYAVAKRGGVSTIRSLAARRYSDVVIDVTIGEGDDVREWRYRVVFGQDSQRRARVKEEIVWRRGKEVLRRPDALDKADSELLAQTHLEQVSSNKEFRDVARFFRTIRYRHIVPQLIREPDRMAERTEDPYGGDFLEQMASTPAKTQKSRLNKIAEALRVALPQLKKLELKPDDRGTPHLRGQYEHWRPQGAWQTEEQFSDGTLRLIGLLWSFLDTASGGPLLLEEPELSLHPEVVRQLPRLMVRMQRRNPRQILLTTHSPDLLSDPGIGLDEVLLLAPEQEGASIYSADSIAEVSALLTSSGDGLGEIVIPRTRPRDVQQLSMFPD